MTKFQQLLLKLGACQEARDWVGDKSFVEAWRTCEELDDLVWFSFKLIPHGLPEDVVPIAYRLRASAWSSSYVCAKYRHHLDIHEIYAAGIRAAVHHGVLTENEAGFYGAVVRARKKRGVK